MNIGKVDLNKLIFNFMLNRLEEWIYGVKNNKAGKYSKIDFISKNYPEILELLNTYDNNLPLLDRIYLEVNNLKEPPKCKCENCNNIPKLTSINIGYRTYCSKKCGLYSSEVNNKRVVTMLNRVDKDDIDKKRIATKKFNRLERLKSEFNLNLSYSENINNVCVYNNCDIHDIFCVNVNVLRYRFKKEHTLCTICNDPKLNSISEFQKSVITEIEKIIDPINIIINDRTLLKPKELDIYIPSLNFAIECHGIFWHSNRKRSNFDSFKYNECLDRGIKLFIIWEHDWYNNKESVMCNINKVLNCMDYRYEKVLKNEIHHGKHEIWYDQIIFL